jgi:Osmosensitive K+ channel histidine kinase
MNSGNVNVVKKKETARANWIAGVSHDIRNPLSMVMGYAGQLKDDTDLTPEEQKKQKSL